MDPFLFMAALIAESSKLIRALGIICLVAIPLGIWKLVEIIIWLVSHIDISIAWS